MLDGFASCRLLDAANAVDAWGGLWPVLVGLAVLATIRRQPPGGWLFRIVGSYVAVLLFALAVSPSDPLTGRLMPSHEVKTLAVSIGVLLGLIANLLGPDRLE
jgi:hypothetical protein